MSKKTETSKYKAKQKKCKDSRFLSLKVMATMKQDEANINARAKRKGKKAKGTRKLMCSCGEPDCAGLVEA